MWSSRLQWEAGVIIHLLACKQAENRPAAAQPSAIPQQTSDLWGGGVICRI